VPKPQAHVVPTIPASAGALVFDPRGRLLVLKPTYKSGWTLPGGELEDTGETPWEGCRREVREECGLEVTQGRLACVDTRPARPARPGRPERRGGVRFLFDCGPLDDDVLAGVVLQPAEISQFRLVEVVVALALLRPPVRRRVAEVLAAPGFVYLENGRRVDGVS
jgi:ADP-ribose pyrophosphatase YjhB (NUDIX family)